LVVDSDVQDNIRPNSDHCALEPILCPGAIQPHGVLVGLDAESLALLTKSANLDGLFPDMVYGEIPVWLPENVIEAFRGLRQGDRPEFTLLSDIAGQGQREIHGFIADGVLFCEFELAPSTPIASDFDQILLLVNGFIQQIDTATNVGALSQRTAEAVRAVSGFERVLVYRFDADGNGDVLAESKVGDWTQSLQGLRFPESDIPAQARALYRGTPDRWIPQRDYAPVPLTPKLDPGGRAFNIGYSHFRSVSPLHRMYQRNIDVDGAMSVSVICEDKLWGLIIGHHRRPHRVASARRHQVNAIVRAFSRNIRWLQKDEAGNDLTIKMHNYSVLLCRLAAADDFLSALTEGNPTIKELLPACTGAAVLWVDEAGPQTASLGTVPPEKDLLALADWIRSNATGPVFATDHLPSCFPQFAAHHAIASGVLAGMFDDARQPIFLLFRPEILQSVAWAGKPEKLIGPNGIPNLPRRSFDRWTEIKRNYSAPWLPADLDIAKTLCLTVNDGIVHQNRRIRRLDSEVERLSLSNLRNRLFLQLASDGIHILSVDGFLIEASDSFCRMLGYRREQMIGMHITEWDANFTSDEIAESIAQRITKQDVWTFETIHRRKNGSFLIVEVSNTPLQLDGEIFLYNSSRDITERKKIEAELRRLNEAVRQCAEAIIVFNPLFIIEFANPAFEKLFGYSQSELKGQNLSMMLPEDPVLRAENGQKSGFFQGEVLRRAKDGQNIPILLKVAPLNDDHGTPIGFVAAMTDLTELKHAQWQAESSNRAKSGFLANMSHELRTPMSGIIGLTHLLRSENLPDQTRERVDAIARSAQRLLGLLNDILDISKIEAGKIALEYIPFSLKRLIEDTSAMLRPAAETKGLVFSVQAAADLPQNFAGDPLRIGQMLLNLIGNAIKFTESGSILVVVEAADSARDSAFLRFSVTDTGIGLSPGQQENLFQPFQQADGSTTRKYGGSGLGLAIVKQMAALMGGQVGVESSLGSGSKFWFTLKLQRLNDDQHSNPIAFVDQSRSPDLSPLNSDHGILRGTRVLLAEDDVTNQTVAVGLLESIGLLVDLANNGAAAVEMAKKGDYEIVLMDMQMPELDGIEATRRIRQDEALSHLPIIALTANAMRDHEAECLSAGMNDFLSKPFDPEQLFAVIQKWVTGLGDAAEVAGFATKKMVGADIPLPSHIEGLDLRAGLRRVAGMRGLYVKCLRNFFEQQQDCVPLLRQLIKEQAIERATREAHTLKGSAAMIDAAEVAELASRLEMALAAEDSLSPLLDQLEKKLTPLLTAISAAIRHTEQG